MCRLAGCTAKSSDFFSLSLVGLQKKVSLGVLFFVIVSSGSKCCPSLDASEILSYLDDGLVCLFWW